MGERPGAIRRTTGRIKKHSRAGEQNRHQKSQGLKKGNRKSSERKNRLSRIGGSKGKQRSGQGKKKKGKSLNKAGKIQPPVGPSNPPKSREKKKKK